MGKALLPTSTHIAAAMPKLSGMLSTRYKRGLRGTPAASDAPRSILKRRIESRRPFAIARAQIS